MSDGDRIVILKAGEDSDFDFSFPPGKAHQWLLSWINRHRRLVIVWQEQWSQQRRNEKGSRGRLLIKEVQCIVKVSLPTFYFRRSPLYRNLKTSAWDLTLRGMKTICREYKCLNAECMEGTVLNPVLYPHRTWHGEGCFPLILLGKTSWLLLLDITNCKRNST